MLVQFRSVQDGVHALGKAHDYVLHRVSATVPVFVWTMMAISIISRKIIKCFSFHTSLLHAVSGVMSLALCLQVVSQALQHFLRGKPLVMVNLSTSLCTWSFPFTPACPWQFIHKFWRWMLNTDTCKSGLPVPFFIASSLNLGIRTMGYTRNSIEYSTILKVI